MRVFYCDHFVLPLPSGHRFPMEKYALLRERVTRDAEELGASMLVPAAATDAELSRVHDAEYVKAVTEGDLTSDAVRRIGFPWSPELVERSRRSVGGTMGAARAALEDGVGVNLAGGTHHAFAGHGEGFCVFNDVAVAIQALRAESRARTFAVVDLDVHQGNGTATLFDGDADVFTLSVHGASNYPFRKTQSDLDIALPDGAGDDVFLDGVRTGLAAAVGARAPDLVFYVAGADAHEGDRLGRLSVSKDGMFERDRLVVRAAEESGAALAVVMAGGYGEDVNDTVDIHHHSVRTALGGA